MGSIYSNVIEIAKHRENSQWELGDAILQAVGTDVSSQGPQDGSRTIIEEIARELQYEGIDYTVTYLSQLRVVSWKFPKDMRSYKISWSCHQIAGSPQMLQKILAIADRARIAKITQSYVRSTRQAIEEGAPKGQKLLKHLTNLSVELPAFINEEIVFELGDEERDMVVKKANELIHEIHQLLKSLGNPRSYLRSVGE